MAEEKSELPVPLSLKFYAACAKFVAQIFNLLYRGFLIRWLAAISNDWPNTVRRYGRIQFCATSNAAVPRWVHPRLSTASFRQRKSEQHGPALERTHDSPFARRLT
jgi:hypothetical protein